MSNMQDNLDSEFTMTYAPITEAAMQSIEASETKSRANSYALVSAFSGYGAAATGEGLFGRISRGAMWFCLWFAMVVPVLLFWNVMF